MVNLYPGGGGVGDPMANLPKLSHAVGKWRHAVSTNLVLLPHTQFGNIAFYTT